MKLRLALAFALVAVAGGLVWFGIGKTGSGSISQDSQNPAQNKQNVPTGSDPQARQRFCESSSDSVNPVESGKSAKPRRAVPLPPVDDGLSDGEREAMDKMDEFAAEEDFDAVKSMLRAYGPSKNPAVRERVVQALGWFGEKAIVDLTAFLGDESEDVRSEAATQWNAAVAEIEDDKEKSAIVAQAMLVLTDPDTLEEVAFHLFSIDEAEAVAAIKGVVAAAEQTGNAAAVAAAKEAYEFITGNEFDAPQDAPPDAPPEP